MGMAGTPTDPHQITDLISSRTSKHHTARRPYVYFEEMAHGPIKIGYVGTLKQGLTRRADYKRKGAKLLAVVPGRDIEERELHVVFASDLMDGREYFKPTDRLINYVTRLIERNYAAPTYEQAEYLGWTDFQNWKPGAPSLMNAENDDGQISLFATFPPRERLAHAAQSFSALSLTDDWYTPTKWVDLARTVMGGIDLDPASCKQANDECVGARHWYTKEQDGLDLHNRWFGRMWINPPYGTGPGSQKMFIRRLFNEVGKGTVQQAVTCLNLNTMCNKWFSAHLSPIASAHCIPTERIEFVPPSGISRTMGSATNGTVFTYVGPNVSQFADVYSAVGQVVIPFKHGLPLHMMEAAE